MSATNDIITEHWNDLLFPSLLFKNYSEQAKQNDNSFFDTSKEEQFISSHLKDFINKEEMLELPIACIYRILKQFYSNKNEKNEIASEATSFLFKCLDKYGKRASILFTFVDFGEEKTSVVNRLLEEYSETFDFSMINHTLTKTVKELTSELTKQKEEYSKLFLQMKEAFDKQVSELNKIKEEAKEKQSQDEIHQQERNKQISDEIQLIKDDADNKMNQIGRTFEQICKKQEEIIDNGAVKRYNQIILNTVAVELFLKLEDEMKEYIVNEVQKNSPKIDNQEDFNKRMHLLQLIVSMKFISEKENIGAVQLIKDDIKIDNMRLDINKIENIYEKGLISPILTHCFKNCNHFTVDIKYPCNQFQGIMKTIFEVKSQHQDDSKKMKISLFINEEDYFEQGFQWNNIIDECTIGKWLTGINKKQYYDFTEIEKVNLSSGITSINAYAFSDCTSLKQVTIPTTLTQIGDYAFSGCTSLTQITFPSSSTQTGDCSPTQATAPSSAMKIGDYSFSGCTSLAQVTIPTSVTQIGEHCFDGCSKLSRLAINPFCTQFKTNSFNNCPSLKDIAFSTSRSRSKSNEIIFPSFMTELLCKTNNLSSSEITSLINDSSEVKIEIEYPSGDFSITLQKVADVKRSHSSKIKIIVIYTKIESGSDPRFYENKEIDCVNFDSKVKEIPNEGSGYGRGLFEKCASLADVIIPSSMTRIGNRAFYECRSLRQITFEQPSLMKEIGDYAFQYCSSLAQISIPPSISSIGYCAFYSCSLLAQISIPSSVTSIGNSAFEKCSKLTQISIPSSISSIGDSTFYHCSKLTQISIPSSVSSIGNVAFNGCSSLTQISIPPSVSSIGNSAFQYCSKLTQISFETPPSVSSIGEYAFRGCSSLKQISIPPSVISNGNGAFNNCSLLTQISIP